MQLHYCPPAMPHRVARNAAAACGRLLQPCITLSNAQVAGLNCVIVVRRLHERWVLSGIFPIVGR
jgi:hypothetical protein